MTLSTLGVPSQQGLDLHSQTGVSLRQGLGPHHQTKGFPKWELSQRTWPKGTGLGFDGSAWNLHGSNSLTPLLVHTQNFPLMGKSAGKLERTRKPGRLSAALSSGMAEVGGRAVSCGEAASRVIPKSASLLLPSLIKARQANPFSPSVPPKS